MIDAGLLATGLAMWLVVASAARWAPPRVSAGLGVLDVLVVPVMVGVLAGRAAAVLLDDPASLRSLKAFLVIRGGVEFWAGVVVMAALVLVGAGRRGEPGVRMLAELSPFLLWGYAVYEAACLVREGCYGPVSPVGLTPEGLRTPMFPVGVVVACAIAGLGFMVRRMDQRAPVERLLLGIGGVALARSVASIWLPRLGEQLTRQHVESLVVLGLAGLVLVSGHLTARWRDSAPVSEAS